MTTSLIPTSIESHAEAAALLPVPMPANVSGAASDAHLIDLWLQGRSQHTERAYRADATRFLTFLAKPLCQTTVADLAAFADGLDGAPTSRSRTLSAIKSLLSFAHRTGYLGFNVGVALRLPKLKSTLAERILTEAEVHRMLALEPKARNRALLRLAYGAGLRVSELCGLCWRDAQSRDDAGQLTIFGKGGKTRAVLVSASTWAELIALRGDAGPDSPVFRSRRGGPLDSSAVLRLVRAAAKRAGINGKVSPHWLRHAHASHALDRGAPIHLVQATLGHATVATTGRYLHARPNESSSRFLAV